MTEHRVATHLGVDPAAYDRQIGRWVPGYEDMIATVVSILAAGISAEEARGLFAQWAGEDRYFPLTTELGLLADAGFPRPECFWKQGAPTVFGGFRAPGA